MTTIRDATENRVRAIAESRPGRTYIPLNETELTWIEDQERTDLIPPLNPNQYWQLILTLSKQVRRNLGNQVGQKETR